MTRYNCHNKKCKDHYKGECYKGKYIPINCKDRITLKSSHDYKVRARWCICIVDKCNNFIGFILKLTKEDIKNSIDYLNNEHGYKGYGRIFRFRTI